MVNNMDKKTSDYIFGILKKIKDIKESQDPPIEKLRKLIALSPDYNIKESSATIDSINLHFACYFGNDATCIPSLVDLVLDIADTDIRFGQDKKMYQWDLIILAITKKYREFLQSVYEASEWHSKYDEVCDNCKNIEKECDFYKDLLSERPGAKKFNVRQTSILALALCKKAGIVPNNKKNISPVFNGMTGYSANTLGQNFCASYTDEEIEELAAMIEKDMPEFAKYLREKTFFLPEITK